jgi:hypothetical protein
MISSWEFMHLVLAGMKLAERKHDPYFLLFFFVKPDYLFRVSSQSTYLRIQRSFQRPALTSIHARAGFSPSCRALAAVSQIS